MVADQHRRAGRPLRVQATTSVGQHDGIGPGTDGRAHPVHHLVRPLTFVQVGTAREDRRDPARGRGRDPKRSAVTNDRRLGEPRQFGQLAATDQLTKIIAAAAIRNQDEAMSICAISKRSTMADAATLARAYGSDGEPALGMVAL